MLFYKLINQNFGQFIATSLPFTNLVTRVYRDGQLVDAKKDLFGYRYYNWTPNEGFSLNGERIKFHGVSLHHDHGALGAEENYKAEYRRLKTNEGYGCELYPYNPQPS